MPPAPRFSVLGLFRLVHPFPILVDGAATAAIALLAGGPVATSTRLGLAMIALQASIGALNDLVDAPLDAGRKMGKPIPSQAVSPFTARTVVLGTAGLGLGLSVPSGAGLLVVACLGLAIGYVYDLVAKGTAWSWLPFTIGIPLLPVFGWYGATGSLPVAFAVLLPMAVMAGAVLAIANAQADLERDLAAGISSVAIRLGPLRAWMIEAVLVAFVVVIALGSLILADAPPVALVAAVGAALLLGSALALGRSTSADWRERAWEVQAIALALLGALWLWGIGPAR